MAVTAPDLSAASAATPLRAIPLGAWWVLALMTIDSVLGMIDRNAVSVLKPVLKLEFGLDDSQYSLLVTAFMVPFAIFYALTGKWVDRYGSRVTLTVFVVVWSLATIGAGFAQDFPQLLVARAILGAAEAGLLPASMLALVSWFPRDRLATAYAIKNPLQALGPILTPPVVVALTLYFGWRAAFWVPGAIGLVFALLWWLADRHPPRYGAAPATAVAPVGPLALLATRAIWGVLLFRLVSDPVWFFFQYWQAGYLQESLGLSLADVGQLLWIPPAVNAVVVFASAAWSDRMVGRGMAGARARLRVMYTALVFAPLIALLPFVRDTGAVIAILTTTYILSYTWLYLSNIMVADLFPRGSVGSAVGLVNCVGTVGAAAFNLAAGPVIDTWGYAPVFLVCAVLHPIAAVIAWRFYGTAKAPPRNAHSDTIDVSTPAASRAGT